MAGGEITEHNTIFLIFFFFFSFFPFIDLKKCHLTLLIITLLHLTDQVIEEQVAILVEEVEAIVIIEKHLLEDPVDRMCIF